jgi:hypothetical protein
MSGFTTSEHILQGANLSTMKSLNFIDVIRLAFMAVCLSSISIEAFQSPIRQRRTMPITCILSNTRLNAENQNKERRAFLSRGGEAMALVLLGGLATTNQPAEASYTAYVRREDDWKQRVDKGGEMHRNDNSLSLAHATMTIISS